jgi:polysaccharide export outer membrane protein
VAFKVAVPDGSSGDLIRLNINGIVSQQAVAINLAQGVSEKSNPILQENDIIMVSRSGTTRIVDTLGLFLNSAA